MKNLKENMYFVHPTADIHPHASIGKDCQIWNWSKIREHATIGSSTKIGQCCYIDIEVSIGENCKIQNGVQLYKGVIIGNNVFIGPNVTFTNDKYPRAFNQNWKIDSTFVANYASIGAGSVIVCGVSIGEYAMIGAGAVVTRDVPDYALVTGNPAQLIGYVDKLGRIIKRIS